MNEDVKSENAHIHSRADELIACLEGEIAERDARIVELESDLAGTQSRVLSLQDQWRKLDAELAAIKAQEPVGFADITLRSFAKYKSAMHCLPMYAAPVSEAKAQDFEPLVCDYCDAETQEPWHGSGMLNGVESRHIHACSQCRNLLPTAKAQGVVMPAELDRAFITGESCDGVYRVVIQSETLKEMQSVHRWLARLKAAPVQQVSVPDERIIPTSAELIQWAWEEEPEETRFQEGYSAAKRWVKMQIEAGIAAPEAPAADAIEKGLGQLRAILSAPSPAGVDGEHEAQPEVAENTGSRSMANKLQSQGCTGRTEVDGVAAPDEASDAVDIYAWSTFDGEGGYDLRLYENNETYQAEWLALNGEKYSGWVEPLCRLSDAQAIIDGLRGENKALHAQVKALQSDANSWQSGYDEGRRMGGKHCALTIDQQAQRIGELEQILRDLVPGCKWRFMRPRIDAALPAGKDSVA